METFLAYLPYLDMTGLVLAVLLVWQANRLDKQVRTYSKQTDATAQQLPQRFKEVGSV